eukprot:scaffold111_cov252-Pinguiococcus_pyrenoidosus.AAC.5
MSLMPTCAHEVHVCVLLQMRAPHVSEQRDVPVVGALVLLHLSGIGDVLDAVHKQVGMGVPPEQRPKLQAAHVEVQQPDLALWVLAVRHSVHVEHLCALVDLRPEAMLELLLRVPQGLVLAKRIQLREHAHDPRKAVDLEDVQELEGFHLEAEARVDEQQDQIRDLGQVHHGAEVMCRALEERHAAPLARDHRDGASDLPDVAVGVELHERADQGALAAAGWPHHDGDEGRRLIFRAVHHGDVLLALRSVQVALRAALRPPHIRDAEGARVMALRRQSALLLLGDALLVCLRKHQLGASDSGPSLAPRRQVHSLLRRLLPSCDCGAWWERAPCFAGASRSRFDACEAVYPLLFGQDHGVLCPFLALSTLLCVARCSNLDLLCSSPQACT